MLGGSRTSPHAQQVGRHIADDDTVGIEIAIPLKEGVSKCLRLSEGTRNAKIGAVLSERELVNMHEETRRTCSSSVSSVSRSISPRDNVPTTKMATIFQCHREVFEGPAGRVVPYWGS